MTEHRKWLDLRERMLDEPSREQRLLLIEQTEQAIKRELRSSLAEGFSTSSDRRELETALQQVKELREQIRLEQN